MRLGMRKIQSITDQSNASAIACNVGWLQALGEVSRATPWNCIKKRAYLGLLNPAQNPYPQFPPNTIPSSATTWAPGTSYAVNQLVIYAGYLYQCLIANTSSGSFVVDLTKGYWFQTNEFSPNYLGPLPGNAGPLFEWAYAYQLPGDFVALIQLNNQSCWNSWGSFGGGGGTGANHEIYKKALYTNASYANIKYNRFEADTTCYDPMFTAALYINLAAIIATDLRKDDSSLSMRLRQEYMGYIAEARVKNAGEDKPRRYNIVSESRFVASRYRSTNG